MKRYLTRAASLLLCMLMLVTAFPLAVFAADQSESLEELMAKLSNYDALYDTEGMTHWYSMSDAKDGDKTPTDGAILTNKLGEGTLALSVLGTKTDDAVGSAADFMYGDGFLRIPSNAMLSIKDFYQTDASFDLTVSTVFAYAQEQSKPALGEKAPLLSESFAGMVMRPSFSFGALALQTGYLTAAERKAIADLAAAYRDCVAEYEAITGDDEQGNLKDTKIAYLDNCEFKTPSGLEFGDVYYLLNPEQENLREWTGTGEAYDAKWYTYLTYPEEYYTAFAVAGAIDPALTAGDKAVFKGDVLSRPFGAITELTVREKYASGAYSAYAYENGALLELDTEGVTVSGKDLILLRDTAADIYDIRIYEGAVSERQLKQNHFADIAKYYKLSIYYFLQLTDEKKADVYDAFAGIAIGDKTKEEMQTILDNAIKSGGSGAVDYDSLYVTDVPLLFAWDASSMKEGDAAVTGIASSVGDKTLALAGTPYNGYLRSTSVLDLTSLLPTYTKDGYTLNSDVTIMIYAHQHWDDDFKATFNTAGAKLLTDGNTLVTRYAEAKLASGRIEFVSQNPENAENKVPGYIKYAHMGRENLSGSVSTIMTDDYSGAATVFSSDVNVPFHFGFAFDFDCENTVPQFKMSLLRDGMIAATSAAWKYFPSASTQTFKPFSGMCFGYRSIRVYDGLLNSEQMLQNIFADFAKTFKLDIFEYSMLGDAAKSAVHQKVAKLNVAGLDEQSAQKALNSIIEELPAAVRFDYTPFYVTDTDGDGESNLLFAWDAFDLKEGDGNLSALLSSVGGGALSLKGTAYDGFLRSTAALDLGSLMPTYTKDGYVLNSDVFFEIVAHQHWDEAFKAGFNTNKQLLTYGNTLLERWSDDGAFEFKTQDPENPDNKYPGFIKYAALARKAPESGSKSNFTTDDYSGSIGQVFANEVNVPFHFGFGFAFDCENENPQFGLSVIRDGKIVKQTSWQYIPQASKQGLKLLDKLCFGYRVIRVYDDVLTEAQMAQNRFADMMKSCGLNPLLYLTGSEEQRAAVKKLLENETVGISAPDMIRSKYNSIFAEKTDFTPDELYLQDKLLFAYDAFGKNAGDAIVMTDKNGVPFVSIDSGASYTYENGALVLAGNGTNGGFKVDAVLPATGYTVQVLMGYRSNGIKSGLNASGTTKEVFTYGGLSIGNTFDSGALSFVTASPITVSGKAAGTLDGYTDVDTYAGRMFAGADGKVFDFTTVVTATGATASPAFYRDGKLVLSLDKLAYTRTDGVTIGNSADLAIYAVRIYGTRLDAFSMAQNHFADLVKYHGVDLSYFNQLSNEGRSAAYEAFASVALEDTSKAKMEDALRAAYLAERLPGVSAETFVSFDGYSARLYGASALRAVFTLNACEKDSFTVTEIGALYGTARDGYASYEALTLDAVENGFAKTVLYNGSGFASGKAYVELLSKAEAIARKDDELLVRHYVTLTDGTEEFTLYGDASTPAFGDTATLTEISFALMKEKYRGTYAATALKAIEALYLDENANADLAAIEEACKTLLAMKETLLADTSALVQNEKAARESLDALISMLGKTGDADTVAKEAVSAAILALNASENEDKALDTLATALLSTLNALAEKTLGAIGDTAQNDKYAETAAAMKKLAADAEKAYADMISTSRLLAIGAKTAAVNAESVKTLLKAGESEMQTLSLLIAGDDRYVSVIEQTDAMAKALGYDLLNLALYTNGRYLVYASGVWTEVSGVSLDRLATQEKWDAIVLSPDEEKIGKGGTDAYLAEVKENVKALANAGGVAPVVLAQGWQLNRYATTVMLGELAKHDGRDASRLYEALVTATKTAASESALSVIPTATAIANVKSGIYGDALFIAGDSRSLSDIGAYTVAMSILAHFGADVTSLGYKSKSMTHDEEITWICDSVLEAKAAPYGVTQAKAYVSDGVMDDDSAIVIAGVGQSNMSNGPYFTWLHTYFTLRNPGKSVVITNEGIPGESVGGVKKRLDYIIEGAPDVVILHHGVFNYMYDCFKDSPEKVTVSTATKEERLKNHEETLRLALDKFAAAGIEVILSCEGTSDGPKYAYPADFNLSHAQQRVTAIFEKLMNEKKADGSRAYPALIGYIGSSAFFEKMKADNEGKCLVSDFHIFADDGLHFAATGGAAMTFIMQDMLQSLTTQSGIENYVGGLVSEVELNADGTTVKSENATVSGVNAANGGISYTYLANSLPMPNNASYKQLAAIGGVDMSKYNSEIIRVTGLASGTYELKMDGVLLGTYTAAQLAAGVNIAELASNPAQAQANAVYNYISGKSGQDSNLNNMDHCLYTFYNAGFMDRLGNFKYSEELGRYYTNADLDAYVKKNFDANSSNWYQVAMYSYFKDKDPAKSHFMMQASYLATVNKYTYLAQQAAIPVEHTVTVTPAS